MARATNVSDPAGGGVRVHLLDVGPQEYGDAVLCQFGATSVLIDGAHPGDQVGKEGHPSIPDQLGDLLNQNPPYHVSLLIVSHTHEDHIGCLPFLVKDEELSLSADWALVADPGLGWGRASGEDRDAGIPDERVRLVVAGLREEVRTARTDDVSLQQFLADAAALEDRYNSMLATLEERGTHLVRFGRDSHASLVKAFKKVGLRILGPGRAQLLECAEIINRTSRDAIRRVSDLFRQDATLDLVDAYRQLVGEGLDALDASRSGPAVNLQSVVTRFKVGKHRFLFAGDMQFERTEVSSDVVESGVVALRKKVSQEAPFGFVKLSHHGSDNAFSEDIFQELAGSDLFGVCAGERSAKHPNPETLAVLKAHEDDIRWARTDHNGQVRITFGQGKPKVVPSDGKLNDPQPNTTDVGWLAAPGTAGGALTAPGAGLPGAVVEPVAGWTAAGPVEVQARIPNARTRVTVTVDVQPGAPVWEEYAPAPASALAPSRGGAGLDIAGGRRLPALLFVTSREALAENIGRAESDQLLNAFRDRRLLLYDEVPRALSDSTPAAALVRQRLRQHPEVQGVVLIGGYDVVPAQILDCLPQTLRRDLPPNDDPDQFIVWSDDIYADRDGDGLPEIPVSRIPDGRSARLVFAAVQARPGPAKRRRSGVRNVARPFAERIYGDLPGAGGILVSRPTTYDQEPEVRLDAEQVYLMLHGDHVDASRFWGEGTPNNVEAVNVSNVAVESARVVFTGCCWGGLIAETPAWRVFRNRPFGHKTPEASIALSFLSRGALAFVGCTGAHYSPTEPPYDYFGGPMHEAFWQRYNSGAAPAKALCDAKVLYLQGMPHGQVSPSALAVEFKILRQYTCLGLGW